MNWLILVAIAWALCALVVLVVLVVSAATMVTLEVYPTTLSGWLLVALRVIGGPVTVIWMLTREVDDSGDTRGGQP